MATKYIFITGGVVSSLGKGISASSLGMLLKARGFKVSMMKFDPYLNYDPGTMSPYQHGEVYVTKDGAETDLDLGHYERWIDEDLTKECSITSGKIYMTVLEKERRGDYLGATIQTIPHITGEIKNRLFAAAKVNNADIMIAEIGGTVGDMEQLPFLEALRQVRNELGYENTMFIHNTLVPYLATSGETKTKPTQQSVSQLLSVGIQPDAIILRTSVEIEDSQKKKVSLFCNVPSNGVFVAKDEPLLYLLPISLKEQGLDTFVLQHFGLLAPEADLTAWNSLIEKVKAPRTEVRIALVGKYVELHDAYLSVRESLRHAGYNLGYHVTIDWVSSMEVTRENVAERLKGADGVLVPGGFGYRGIEGKLAAVEYARTHNVPFLGICLGLQLSVIEFAQHVLGLEKATSTEFDPQTPDPIIDFVHGQYEGMAKGGTMRLGEYACQIKDGTLAMECYQKSLIGERHRHRYELNPDYIERLAEKGMIVSGVNPESGLSEIVEIPANDFFIASQFHPEFTSRPLRPNPLFNGFVKAAGEYRNKKK